jgi:hypothetical protein
MSFHANAYACFEWKDLVTFGPSTKLKIGISSGDVRYLANWVNLESLQIDHQKTLKLIQFFITPWQLQFKFSLCNFGACIRHTVIALAWAFRLSLQHQVFLNVYLTVVLCSWYLQFFNCRNLVNSWHWERLLVSNPQQRRCISHPLIGYICQLMAHSLLLFLRCNNCLRLCSMSWLELEFCCTGVRAISQRPMVV